MIDNNSLAAITLMIALSNPADKDIMRALVTNMLCDTGNQPQPEHVWRSHGSATEPPE